MSFHHTWAASRKTKAATGFRSKLEVETAKALDDAQVPYEYEAATIPYTKPATYLPDFILPEQAIIIEDKGHFTSEDRAKILRVKAAHPALDIRFLFSNPNTRIGKQSKTTYGAWCDKHGFMCAKGGTPPSEWFEHTPTPEAKEALKRILTHSNGKKND